VRGPRLVALHLHCRVALAGRRLAHVARRHALRLVAVAPQFACNTPTIGSNYYLTILQIYHIK
jgi:hypothetical protein